MWAAVGSADTRSPLCPLRAGKGMRTRTDLRPRLFVHSITHSVFHQFIHSFRNLDRTSVCLQHRVPGPGDSPSTEKKEGGQQTHPQGGAQSTPELAGVAWEGRAVLSEATGDLSEERTDTRLSPEARPVRTWWAGQLQDGGGPVRTPWWCFG